jgi:hypothetical protein
MGFTPREVAGNYCHQDVREYYTRPEMVAISASKKRDGNDSRHGLCAAEHKRESLPTLE